MRKGQSHPIGVNRRIHLTITGTSIVPREKTKEQSEPGVGLVLYSSRMYNSNESVIVRARRTDKGSRLLYYIEKMLKSAHAKAN